MNPVLVEEYRVLTGDRLLDQISLLDGGFDDGLCRKTSLLPYLGYDFIGRASDGSFVLGLRCVIEKLGLVLRNTYKIRS